MKFQTLMLETSGIDPLNSLTIASAAMNVYRTLCVRETWQFINIHGNPQTIFKYQGKWVDENDRPVNAPSSKPIFISTPLAHVPQENYLTCDQFSKISIYWLENEIDYLKSIGKPCNIIHAMNGNEKIIRVKESNLKADGYLPHPQDPINGKGTVYLFHGCIFHGCPKCFPKNRFTQQQTLTKMNHNRAFQITAEKTLKLKEAGYTVIEMWECNFKLTPAMKNKHDFKDRLKVRDSFFGGRTSAIKLHHTCAHDEEIHYVDFTSLYPFVNKTKRYPVGHPEIITHNFGDIHDYF
jgi:G:T-mismatch repair DNA endonuclease (very short patch repair protein)